MQKKSLFSKVVLVTGAARRIGAEISKTLHDAGMNVVLHYNSSEEEALSLGQELNQKRGHSAYPIRADLQDGASARDLVKHASEIWGRLDILVNNASRFYRTAFGKVTDYAWNDILNSNLKMPFFLAQSAAPLLAANQGLIINIADIHGERPLTDYSVYCISKAGLIMATKVLAKELGPLVRVNAISPGAILWPEGDNALTDAIKQKIIDHTLLQKSGNPSDIANAVLFLARDADYITGQVITIDGGRLLTS